MNLLAGIETMHMIKKGQLRYPIGKLCLQLTSSIAWLFEFRPLPQLSAAVQCFCNKTQIP